MRCVGCWFNLLGRVYTTATMIVNGLSVCDNHADVAYRAISVDHLILLLSPSPEDEKAEDDAIEARRVGLQ